MIVITIVGPVRDLFGWIASQPINVTTTEASSQQAWSRQPSNLLRLAGSVDVLNRLASSTVQFQRSCDWSPWLRAPTFDLQPLPSDETLLLLSSQQ
jgi:hypothetical protein